MTERADEAILAAYNDRSSREQAFRWLVDKYSERLYYVIRRMMSSHDDTDDVLQNTLVKVWKNLGQFREDAQLYTWLYRIAVNEAMQFLRKEQKRQGLRLSDASEAILGTESNPVSGEEIEEKLQKAILSLPDKQRAVFNLRYYEEMPYEQMSEILETSVGALKASYHHAVKKVEKFVTSTD